VAENYLLPSLVFIRRITHVKEAAEQSRWMSLLRLVTIPYQWTKLDKLVEL